MPDKKAKLRDQSVLEIGSIPVRLRPEHLELARKQGQTSQPDKAAPPQDVRDLKGVYVISVAARLLEMHPQTLRKYERLGLVSPSRTIGMLRLYSEEDIQKLRLIKHLEGSLGLNLAGVEFTLNLLSHILDMLQRLSAIQDSEQTFDVVEREVTQLLQSLNLPLQE
jgi:MerR family transcriptional regulator/heat shock protein HspR